MNSRAGYKVELVIMFWLISGFQQNRNLPSSTQYKKKKENYMITTKKANRFILSHWAPWERINLQPETGVSHRRMGYTHAVVSVFFYFSCCCFLSRNWPLVYRHHQLSTTSSNICSANDWVVKPINLQEVQAPGEMLRNETVKTKL